MTFCEFLKAYSVTTHTCHLCKYNSYLYSQQAREAAGEMKYIFSGLGFSLDDPGFELDGAEDWLVLPGQVVDVLRVARSQPLLELPHRVLIIFQNIDPQCLTSSSSRLHRWLMVCTSFWSSWLEEKRALEVTSRSWTLPPPSAVPSTSAG